MKIIAKGILAGIIAACSLTIVGCGKLDVEKTIDNLMEKNTPGINADIYSTAEIYYMSDGLKYTADYTSNSSLKMSNLETDETRVMLQETKNTSLFGLLEDQSEECIYYDGTEDKAYKQTGDEWTYEMTPSTITAATIAEARFWFLNEWFKSDVQKEKQTIGFYECYVLELNKRMSECMEFLNTEAGILGCTEYLDKMDTLVRDSLGVEPNTLYDLIHVNLYGYIDTDTKRLVAVKLDFSENDIENIIQGLGTSYNQISDSLGIKIDEIGIKRFDIVIIVNGFSSVEIEKPDGIESAVQGDLSSDIMDLSSIDFTNASPDTDETTYEVEIEEAPTFSGYTEVPLYTSDGKEIFKVQVPEGYGHCYESSDPDMVNIMNSTGDMDLYVTSSPTMGWIDTELQTFLDAGAGEYHTMREIDLNNPIGQAYLVNYSMQEMTNRYIVIPYESTYVVVSFNPASIEDMSDDELIAFTEKLF